LISSSGQSYSRAARARASSDPLAQALQRSTNVNAIATPPRLTYIVASTMSAA
jgi:hypothetical protein